MPKWVQKKATQELLDELWAKLDDPEYRKATEVERVRTHTEEPHRGPQGPNEDIGQCPVCWSITAALRPENETFGLHLPDCSLERRHRGYCVGGGKGHEPAEVIRG